VAVGRDACMHDDERRACTNLAYRTNVPTSLEAHNQGTVWHEVKKKQYIWKYLSSSKSAGTRTNCVRHRCTTDTNRTRTGPARAEIETEARRHAYSRCRSARRRKEGHLEREAEDKKEDEQVDDKLAYVLKHHAKRPPCLPPCSLLRCLGTVQFIDTPPSSET
jgi:hypothetical protein